LQPAKPAEKAPEEQEEQKPKPVPKNTEVAMAKPEPVVKPEPVQKPDPNALVMAKPTPKPPEPPLPKADEGDAPKARPRTIKEALARQPPNQLAGQKMKQEGGVKHAAISSSLDVTATAFGAYDAMIIAAIQNHWYSLLDERNFGYERSGRVTISFRLHADGTVTNVEFKDNTVGAGLGLLCQSAIKDPAPYPSWPGDMRRKIGVEYRDVTFTFLYY
jgi:protein TonB